MKPHLRKGEVDPDGTRRRAHELFAQGLTNRQVADRLGRHISVVSKWRKKPPGGKVNP